MHPRGKPLAAARAVGSGILLASLLVEFHPELRGPLEDVKELAERQEEQRGDHRDCMQNRQKAIRRAAQPLLRNSERQPRHRNGEQHDDRQEIHAELLQRARALVGHSTPQRKRDPG